MNNTNGRYRHPLHDAIVTELLKGGSDPDVAAVFGIGRRAVARIRHLEGIPAFTRHRSMADILAGNLRPGDDGHTYWAGCRDNEGTPQVRSGKSYRRASHMVFQNRHGRPPVGQVRADCDVQHCLTASHLMDDLMRRNLYMQMRAMSGLYGHWDTCSVCGADWETSGRVQPNLQIYCTACTTRRSRNLREANR